jgi:hypothetical protein
VRDRIADMGFGGRLSDCLWICIYWASFLEREVLFLGDVVGGMENIDMGNVFHAGISLI